MKNPQQRSRFRLVAGAALTLTTASLVLVPTGSATAADAGDQPFSGSVRNYSAFVGAEVLNTIDARVNIGEAVAVADSTGLNKPGYAGTGTGNLAVPGSVTADPTARSYSRVASLGVGFTGLNIQPLKAESVSTTVVDGALESISTPAGNLDIPILGSISLLTGEADTTWNAAALTSGGRLAYSDANIGTVELLDGLAGLPLPGSLFPLASLQLGQNTSEVKLVGDATACPAGLAVRSEATWDFADMHLLNGFIDVSVGGDAGNPGDSAVMAATANGMPGGARIDAPELGDVTVRVGDASLEIQPGASIEIDQILRDAGGPLGSTLGAFVGGEISVEGVTDITESADGTHAHGALNGVTANLSLLPVPIVAPNGLGSVEVGVMRGEVDAIAPAGGINCTSTGTDASAATATDTSAATGIDASAATATDTSAATATDTSTSTATDTSTSTATDTSAATATDTSAATATETSAATATDTSAATATDTSAATATATDTSAATATDTSAATATDTSAATATDTSAATATDTSAATSTATDTSAATATDTSAATATATDTSAATATDTSAATATATDTSASTGTQVAPPGTTSGTAGTTGTTVNPPGGLPNTGGVPIQLLALALGLVLIGGRLLGASRYWQKHAN